MGVLNCTPDSVSDGGRFATADAAIAAGQVLFAAGADLVDVGGESSRPGAAPVSEQDELARVLPVIAALSRVGLVSVDTMKPAVADAALVAGAVMVNDVSGLRAPEMVAVVARHRAAVCVMHMAGTPQTMQDAPRYDDVVMEVGNVLHDAVLRAMDAGVRPEGIVVDPGIGFGKSLEHNLALLRATAMLEAGTGRPVLVGPSRKAFLGKLTGRAVDERLAGTLGAVAVVAWLGARMVRVHDVAAVADVLHVVRAVRGAPQPG